MSQQQQLQAYDADTVPAARGEQRGIADQSNRSRRKRRSLDRSLGRVRRLMSPSADKDVDDQVDADQAAIVRLIFRDFVNGRSPKAIAEAMNAEGIPGPTGAAWSPSTIYGNYVRGTGILNNEL